MARGFQYRPLKLEHVQDRKLRAALQEMDRNVAGLWAMLRGILETSGGGRVHVKGAVRPRTVAADPTANTTQGEPGEIVEFNGKLYIHKGPSGADKGWVQM